MSCSRTQHGDPNGARTPTSGSRVGGLNHKATAPPTCISGSKHLGIRLTSAETTLIETLLGKFGGLNIP